MDHVSADGEQPWYRRPLNVQPFTLARMISSNDPKAPPFYTTAAFPWQLNSLETLWDGAAVDDPKVLSAWTDMVNEWAGTIVAGSSDRLFLFPKYATVKPFCVNVVDRARKDEIEWKIQSVAWALSSIAPTDPLIVFAASSLIFVLDVKTQKIIGRIRGHGGEITSITVHPKFPYIFCSTSRDMTTRIYDLTLLARQTPNNPHWPPSTKPSLAGPAFGLQMSESEGDGCGRCVGVFVGGRSGGHQAAVFSAAFHPTEQSLVATCGMDRAVKIWRLPQLKPDALAREDKPLFSTDLIHKARVLSISWLSQDVLISHSAPALMRRSSPEDLYEEEGTVVIWRWLGFDRFFPPDKSPQKILRGCASDYRSSESFKIVSCYSLPMTTRKLHIYRSPTHDPLLLIPRGSIIRIINITHFKPRDPPPFPLDDEVVQLTKRMKISHSNNQTDNGNENEDQGSGSATTPYVPGITPKTLFGSVQGWDVSADVDRNVYPVVADVDSCEMAFDGNVILGVGAKGTMFMWKRRPAQPVAG